MYKGVLSTFKKGLSLIALCSFMFSCKLFENDVADFMETYTETAAIDIHTFSVPTYQDTDGNDCINSKQDLEIELFMRNPKKFIMQPSISFENLSPSVDVSRVSIEQTDLYTLKVVMPQEFLLDADEGKDLTTKFTLYEPMSGRVFAGYEIPLSCNTIPPQVQNATILNNNNETFVIFFDMPDAQELAIRHKDIACITINGQDFPVEIADDGSFTFEGTRFSNTPKPGYSIIDSKAFADSDRSVYFETEEPFFMGEKDFTLGLKDKAGLTQTVYTNTEISRLSRVDIKDIDNVVYTTGANEMVAGSNVDPFKITLTPPTTDHKGITVPGQTTLHYALYKGTSTVSALFKEDQTNSAVTFELTEGTYHLETYATLINYEQSPLTCVTLRVVDCAIYVSEDGDDVTADGTRDLPFKTLQAAINDVDTRNMPNDKLNIYASGTLQGTAIVNPTIAKELVISGRPGSSATIDAQGSGPALTIDSSIPITLKNITITNGQAEKGGAILIKSGSKLTLLSGTKITGNTATSNGSAIYVPENTSLIIQDNVEISRNTIEAGHGAVYAAGNISISGAVVIYDNESVGNTNSDLYLTDGTVINITDKLETDGKAAKIGIQTQTIPTSSAPIVITNGYGYADGFNKNVFPGTYFISPEYAIALSADGEAMASTNTGNVQDPLKDLKITFSIETPGRKDSIDYFIAGSSNQANRLIKVIPKIMAGTEDITASALADTENPVIWNISLYLGTNIVDNGTFTTSQFVIPASISYEEIYSLYVQASYKGITFDDEFTLYGYEPE